jgi:anti-sigma factor RsiW
MLHEETMAKAGDLHSGNLTKGERMEVERHLKTCRDCRLLYGRWVAMQPSDAFPEKVMTRLGLPMENARQSARMRRWSLWGTVAAAVLAGAAFWHPERQWMESDKSFAWNERSASAAFRAPVPKDMDQRGLP